MSLLPALVVFAASWVIVAGGEPPSVLRFANQAGDQLTGSLDALEGERLVWKSSCLEKPTPFWLKNVMEVTMPATAAEFKATHEATLTLMNKDSVRGQIASVTDETITLDTWYAGRLNFRRVMVKDVVIDPRPAMVFSGPTGLDGWKQSAKFPAWTYENGCLCAIAPKDKDRDRGDLGIGRDVGLPDESIIAFDMAWRGNLSLDFIFFADDVSTNDPSSGYKLSCTGTYVNIRRLSSNLQLGDGANIPEFRANEKVRMELRASRTTGNLCFYINGRYTALWKDPGAAKAKFGKGIRFVSRGSESLRIAAIKVTAWDGMLEELPDDNAGMMGMMGGGRFAGRPRMPKLNGDPEPKVEVKPKPAEAGRMKLRNGDSIGGEVTSIVDGVITIKTPFADVKLPVARVRNIILKPASLEEPIRRNGDVRAWFGDGSSIVFRLDTLTKDAITGHSQTFGSATFKTTAFNRIEFNIYDPLITDKRAKEGL